MTRIIGGIAGSLKLQGPAKTTRPTADRIRESIFNRLESRDLIDAAKVLDLYAGTGGLALEALSRGAENAVLVEANGKAAAVCGANAKLVQKALVPKGDDSPPPEVLVVAKPVKTYLAATTDDFDLVFIDPPYEVTNDEVTENLTDLLPRLTKNATVVLERSSRGEAPKIPAGYQLDESKAYGDTVIHWISIS
jgi:16S rRNA (guanine966-N2)-methyltransferase